jgi:hypothetical protein
MTGQKTHCGPFVHLTEVPAGTSRQPLVFAPNTRIEKALWLTVEGKAEKKKVSGLPREVRQRRKKYLAYRGR